MSRDFTSADVAPEPSGFVCNDGLFGCNQPKPTTAFYQQSKSGRVSPTLCDSCLNHMAVTFGIPLAGVDVLVIARHQEYSLIRQAKTETALPGIREGLKLLAAGKVDRLSGYTQKLLEAFRQPEPNAAVQRVERAYTRWWRQQLGIDAKPRANLEIAAVAHAALPVGDR